MPTACAHRVHLVNDWLLKRHAISAESWLAEFAIFPLGLRISVIGRCRNPRASVQRGSFALLKCDSHSTGPDESNQTLSSRPDFKALRWKRRGRGDCDGASNRFRRRESLNLPDSDACPFIGE